MRAWLFVACGCGRLGFDATPNDATPTDARICAAPIGHDEDTDGIDDACDGCPHISDSMQPDADGDLVNDGCDPRPNTPGDSISLFDPFTHRNPIWTTAANAVFLDDDLHATAAMGRLALERLYVPETETVQIGGEILALGAGIPHQIIIGAGAGLASIYCELHDDNVNGKLAAAYTFDSSSYAVAYRSTGQRITPGPYELRATFAPQSLGCATTVPFPEPSFVADVPQGINPTDMGVAVEDMDVRFHYLVSIRSE